MEDALKKSLNFIIDDNILNRDLNELLYPVLDLDSLL
jgi:hypothetical protein